MVVNELISLVNDCFAPSAVFIFFFYDGLSVSRLSFFNYGRVVPITIIVPVAFANAYAGPNGTDVNADIISHRGCGKRRNCDNHD
jgi:hypothetical protein